MRRAVLMLALVGCGMPPESTGGGGAGGCSCEEPTTCEIVYCLDGQCAYFIAPDNTPCGSGGICTAGICEGAAYAP